MMLPFDPPHVRVPEQKCLKCGQTLDAVGTVGGQVVAPRPEDVTVCLGCGAVMMFDANLERVPMDDSLLDRDTLNEVTDLRIAIREMQRDRKRNKG